MEEGRGLTALIEEPEASGVQQVRPGVRESRGGPLLEGEGKVLFNVGLDAPHMLKITSVRTVGYQ